MRLSLRWGGRLLTAFIVITSFVFGAGKDGDTRPRITYLSPVPDSPFNLPGTNIILRIDRPVRKDDTERIVRRVTGSASGPHVCAAFVSRDGRTIQYRPGIPFARGESVTADIDTGMASCGDPVRSTGQLRFTITSLSQDAVFPSQSLRMEEIPPLLPLSGRTHSRPVGSGPGAVNLPDIDVELSTPTAPGYLFLSNLISFPDNVPSLLVLRNDGTPVFARNLEGDAHDFNLQPNGELSYSDDNANAFIVMDSSCTVIDTIRCGNGYSTDPHELRILQNGDALLLGEDLQIVDMSQIVPGGFPSAQVIGCIIQELDPDGNVVFQWRSWDHFKITDAMHIDLTASFIDYVHANALDMDTDGNILLSSRHLNEITKIDRETGAIIWRLGGQNNQFTFVNDSIGFSYQHAVRRIQNGHITLFDNGDFHTPPFSRAAEYALDEQKMTATLVWQYRNTPDVFGYAMGYVQRLDNGNTLIGWGAGNPTATEVAPDGTKLFEMTFDEGIYSYRAYRYVWRPAITSVAGGGGPAGFTLRQNYPNPFNPGTSIQYSIPRPERVRLDVYTILGQHVSTLVDALEPAGEHAAHFDGSSLASGVYLYRLSAGGLTAAKEFILLR